MPAMKEKVATNTMSQNETHRLSEVPDVSRGSDVMSKSPKERPMIRVFLADATQIGCELMAAALQRSRMKLTLTGYATDLIGIRAWLRENEVDVVIINADLREGFTAAI